MRQTCGPDLSAFKPGRRRVVGGLGSSLLLASLASRARAQGRPPLRIGVLNDMSGVVADLSGMGTLTSVMMAVEDFGGAVDGRPIEVLQADHHNKADVAAAIARNWCDDGATAIFDVGITSAALAVQLLAREKDRIVVFLSSASSDLTGKACSPNGVHWAYNNYSQAIGSIRYLTASGARTWFFLTVDYSYGDAVQRDTTRMIEAAGGKVIGAVRHSFDTRDFSSALVTAQASKADAIVLATPSMQASEVLKQGQEFGITKGGQRFATLSLGLHEIKALGLETAQGLIETSPYYWDQNDATRAFAARFRARFGRMPNMVQASAWGAVTHYLNAVKAAGTDGAHAVMAQMRATPINDFMTVNGTIRADGRVLRDMYILKVKAPAQSRSEWDLEEVVGRIPAAEAFQPADPAVCPLVTL